MKDKSKKPTVLKTAMPGATVPTLEEHTWCSLGAAVGTKREDKYFVIDTTAGSHSESIFVSFPKEGGFRIQSLHELQKKNGATKPEVSNVGLFEPAELESVSYEEDGDAVKMTAPDGTAVKYTQSADGFALTVLDAQGAAVLPLTNKQLSFAYTSDGKVVRSLIELPLAEKESVYGGGERYNGANQVGKKVSLTNFDCWSLPDYSYINVPLFHSNRGYSVWFNMFYAGEADIGEADENKFTVIFDGAKLDFYMWQGTPLENLKKYTSITGTSGVSETWTYGFWTGAQNMAFEETHLRDTYANMTDLVDGYKERYNFYPEACYAEGEAARTEKVDAYLNEHNVKILGWLAPDLWAYLGKENMSDFLPEHSEFPTVDADGNITDYGHPLTYDTEALKKGEYKFTGNLYADFSNPSSVDLFTACWSEYWDMGVVGTMDDFGEWFPFDATYSNGLNGDEMHNLISYYYAMNANKAWSARHGNNYVLFQRSGCAGSQYYTGNFLGDNVSTYKGGENPDFIKEDGFEHNGYGAVVSSIVAMGASGFNLYGADLGGLGGTPTDDLWNRWCILSLYSPYMRQHGAVIHHPWDHGMLATKNFGKIYYLRKNFVPMIESAAITAEKTSNPIVQGMLIAYPHQVSLAEMENQYLFCDDFLVCPIMDEDVYYQEVSLPKGSAWYEFNTYKAYEGGTTFNAEAPTSDFPVFVKGGAVKAIDLPQSMTFGAEMHDNSGDEFANIPSLLITPPDRGRTSVIYVKQGKSTDYHTYNAVTETYVSAKTSDTAFTVSNKDGSARSIILALGVIAASVAVDGKALERLAAMPDYKTEQYGYYVDTDGLTTIFAPAGWNTLSIEKGTVKSAAVELVGVGANAEAEGAMFGDDVTASYTLPESVEEYTVIELAQKSKIDRIKIGWAVGFSNTYDVEYSVDGENWSPILQNSSDEHTVSGGCGSRDDIRFGAVEAKYLRLRTVELGDAGAPAIYSLSVYAESDKAIESPSADAPGNNGKWDNYDFAKYDEDIEWNA